MLDPTRFKREANLFLRQGLALINKLQKEESYEEAQVLTDKLITLYESVDSVDKYIDSIFVWRETNEQ